MCPKTICFNVQIGPDVFIVKCFFDFCRHLSFKTITFGTTFDQPSLASSDQPARAQRAPREPPESSQRAPRELPESSQSSQRAPRELFDDG